MVRTALIAIILALGGIGIANERQEMMDVAKRHGLPNLCRFLFNLSKFVCLESQAMIGRRAFLSQTGNGFGALALAGMLHRESTASTPGVLQTFITLRGQNEWFSSS